MTLSSKASRVLGSSFHLGTTELSSCVIVATSHWIPSAPLPMLELFSSKYPWIKIFQWYWQRQSMMMTSSRGSTGSKTLPCTWKEHSPLQTRIREKGSHTNWCWKHGELWRLIVQQCAQQHILQLCLHADQNWQNCWISTEEAKDTRKHGRHKEYRIVKHETRPLLQNTTVDCPYNSWKKLRHLWPSENVETLSHTDVRKITPTLTKCLDRADTLQKHWSFHSGRLRGGARDQFMDQVDKRTPVDLGPAATERLDRRGVLTFTHIWTLLKHSLAFCSWTLEDTAPLRWGSRGVAHRRTHDGNQSQAQQGHSVVFSSWGQ